MQTHRGGEAKMEASASYAPAATMARPWLETTAAAAGDSYDVGTFGTGEQAYMGKPESKEKSIRSSVHYGQTSLPPHPGGSHAKFAQRSVIVNYQVPEGSKFIPIMINECVTMIQVGSLKGSGIWEPINTFLRSPEDGLRYHKSMDITDPFKGPRDVLPWGTPVQGEISEDKRWMIDPGEIPAVDEKQIPYH